MNTDYQWMQSLANFLSIKFKLFRKYVNEEDQGQVLETLKIMFILEGLSNQVTKMINCQDYIFCLFQRLKYLTETLDLIFICEPIIECSYFHVSLKGTNMVKFE